MVDNAVNAIIKWQAAFAMFSLNSLLSPIYIATMADSEDLAIDKLPYNWVLMFVLIGPRLLRPQSWRPLGT